MGAGLLFISIVILGIWLDIKGVRHCSFCGGARYSSDGTRCPICAGKGRL